MDWKGLFMVFCAVFLAELGDKTQEATLLFSMEGKIPRSMVFLGAALALVTATALAVVAGGWLGRVLPYRLLRWAAGVGFLIVGLWVLLGEKI
ncbi:MAG: UPF0016 family protein [Deltaproteobacteria bacterium]|nr:MAG: UPF0016 family protein [Deltaproteobacteria bacterium]